MKPAILALLLLFSAGVHAGPYIYGTGSSAQIKANVGDGLSESTRTLSIVGGYRFNKYLAAEVDYLQTGRVHSQDSDRFQGSNTLIGTHLFDAQGVGLSAIGIWPVSERFSFLGKIGARYLELTHTSQIAVASDNVVLRESSSTSTEQVLVPSIGVGAEFSAAREVQFRAMLEQAKGRGTLDSMRLISLSIVFSF